MNDVWNNSTGEVKSKDCIGMKIALSSIAQELQRLYAPAAVEIYSIPREVKSDEIFEKLNMVRSKLSTKRRQIKKLRNNFKTACVVARSVISAKENEAASLSNHIQLTKKQCEGLLQKNRLNSKVIEDLQSESQFLKEKMEDIKFFINLGYKELQKMRNIPYKNLPVMQQLTEIMVSCGQYYSDYCSEQQNREQLEQRNRYLTHKLKILTNSIEAISEELDTMRTQKLRLQAENDSLRRKQTNSKPIMGVQEADYERPVYTIDNKARSKFSSEDLKCRNKPVNLNFSAHLTLIKKLLDDQDDMLKYLKKISDELAIQENCCL